MKRERLVFKVVFRSSSGRWHVIRDGTSHYRAATKREALDLGDRICRKVVEEDRWPYSRLLIYGRDGQMQRELIYGPRRGKG